MKLERFNLEGKVALITGGAGLLGAEHAEAILECNGHVILADLDQERLSATKGRLSKNYSTEKIITCVMDVTNEQNVMETARSLRSEIARVDILINNAAIDPKVVEGGKIIETSRLENFQIEQWDTQVAVGLKGAFICAKVFGSAMAEDGQGGVILNIASDLSVIAPSQFLYRREDALPSQQPVKPVTYSVIKSGLLGLTRYIATYWAEKGIRSNALSPGGVYNSQGDEFVRRLSALIPLNRMAQPNEYRAAVQFLCSDASSYMTGQNIVIDGGRSVW